MSDPDIADAHKIWKGQQARRIRAQVLAASQICGICGHGQADTVDHKIPLSKGGDPLDPANMRPAHGVDGCPTCHRKCNQSRGNTLTPTRRPGSRPW